MYFDVIDACSAPASHSTSSVRTDHADGPCEWCGRCDDVVPHEGRLRCAACRNHEKTIAAARSFIGMYGLRPLGGSTASDDDEELAHRVAARAARAELDRSRLPERPAAPRPRTRTASSVRPPASTAPATSGRSTSVTTGLDPDIAAQRVAVLLGQLTGIESELDDLDGATGLPARARRSDLQRQRTGVLSTLAALEKARRSGR